MDSSAGRAIIEDVLRRKWRRVCIVRTCSCCEMNENTRCQLQSSLKSTCLSVAGSDEAETAFQA